MIYKDPEWNKNYKATTFAMFLAENKLIPLKQYEHDPTIQNCLGYTVAIQLEINGIQTPNQWRYNKLKIIDQNNDTTAMIIASKGVIPSEYWQHIPQLMNNSKNTVAIFLASNNIVPPYQWYHQPNIQNKNNNTVAMLLSYEGTIPPKEWEHSPTLQNIFGDTVGILLSSKGIIPPQQWMHDVNLQNIHKNSILSNLRNYNYIYQNQQFIKLDINNMKDLYQVESDNYQCQICLSDEKQIFIKSNCSHRICFQCFKQLILNKQYNYCPICRNQDWLIFMD